MKTRADQRVQLRQVTGHGIVLIAALAAAACQSERPTGPQTPTTTTTTFQGVLAGPLGESGVITLTTGTGAAGAVAAQRVGAAASNAVTENLSGKLLIIGSASIDLTGTLNTATGAIAVSGGGYSFTGSVTDSKLSGTYTGPNGAGTFTGLSSTASTPTFVSYCGTSSGTDNFGGTPQPRSGAFNLERSGSLLFGVAVDNSPTGADVPVAMVTGQVTGNSVSLTVTDLNGNPVGSATGTISATAASGTYTSSDGLATGTWSASTASCSQSTAAEFTIAPTFDGQSAAFDGTNYLVGLQDQTARNTNQPGVFAQFVSSTGALAGPRLGPLGPSGNHVGDPPCVAFGASNYLMAWAGNFSQTGGDILGQLVPTAGAGAGVGFAITSTHDASSTGGVVFGGGTYFVAYERTSGSLHKIYGRFVSPGGAVGSEFPISSGFGQVHDDICHQVAFDGTNFLVVWIEESSDASLNNMSVKARFVSPSGALGAEVTVNGQGPTKTAAGVAYNGSTYFVTWNAVIDPATYDYDVLGQLVTPTGALSGGVIPIATGSGFQYGQVSAGGGNFLVLWDYFQSTLASAAIKGKIFDGSGTLVGAERTLFAQAADGRVPSLGAEVFNGRDYLVVLGRATAPANPFDFGAYTNWSVDGAFITPWGGATPPSVELSGLYSGTISGANTDGSGVFSGPIEFEFMQTGTTITGTWSTSAGNTPSSGTISGTINGSTFTFTMIETTVCPQQDITGSGTISNGGASISASFSFGPVACSPSPGSGTFVVNRGAPVAVVTVTPATATVAPSGTVQLAATTKDAAGNVLTGRVVTWTSSSVSLATVSPTGLVTGVSAGGPVTITATSEGKSGTASVTVVPPTLYRVWGAAGSDVFAVGAGGTILHYNGTSWTPQASGTTATFVGVWGSGGGDVFAVGTGGTILHYNGTSWTPQASGTTQDLYTVWGGAGSDVFAVGASGTILHYNGTSWTPQMSGTSIITLFGVWGSGGSDVFAVGTGETILHYDGTSWTRQMGGTPIPLFGVWGTGASDVFASGKGGTILHYNGSAWAAQASGTTATLFDVWGASGSDVFAVGTTGTILQYNGTSWTGQASGTTATISGVWGNSGSDIFAVGDFETILHYDGTSWSPHGPGVPPPVASVTVSPATATVSPAGGVQLVATTKDGAGNVLTGRVVTWASNNPAVATVSGTGLVTGVAAGSATITATSEGQSGTAAITVQFSLLSVGGSGATDVFAVGCPGTILHYDGTNWSAQASGTRACLYGVWGSGATDVFAVASDGEILHYDGMTWGPQANPQASGTMASLLDIWGSGATDVFAVGGVQYLQNNGTILHYDGTSWSDWSAQVSGMISGSGFRSVWASRATDVFVVGGILVPGENDFKVLHYNGTSWALQGTGTPNGLSDVWGSGATDVFTVGGGGVILHYDGTTWTAQTSGTTQALTGVWGSGPTDVFAVGSSGTILHYDGTSWSAQTSGTAQPLCHVWGSGATDVYAVVNDLPAGCGGSTLLHYNGTTWSAQTASGAAPVTSGTAR